MPELPEMETYKHNLQAFVQGKLIKNVSIQRDRSVNLSPAAFSFQIENTIVTDIQRRAKHLIFTLSSGNALVLHLMLGGWIFYGREKEKPNRTVQVQFYFGEYYLYFIGLRLGYLHYLTPQELNLKFSDLGPEPLDPMFTQQDFLNRLHGKKGMLKTKLVDQRWIAGIGNCYADEICFHAGILPTSRIEQLSDIEGIRLYEAMQKTLREAISYGGYMEHPFYTGDVSTGRYNEQCRVYDREGEACYRCGYSIQKVEKSSRKIFYCPNCQH